LSSSDTHDSPSAGRSIDFAILVAIAAAVALLHLFTNMRYGFHRDELQFLSDARHLDWGFVAYPPLTPFVERIGLELVALIFALDQLPNRGAPVRKRPSLRKLTHRHYLIIYRVRGKDVLILRVQRGSRDIEALFGR